MVNLDRCVGGCNILNDLSNKVYVPNKTEDLNLSVFNMITEINESKTLPKHISRNYKCKFDGRIGNSDRKWNIVKWRYKCKKHHIREKDYMWNPATWSWAIIFYHLVITCDEIIEETKSIPVNFNEKR